MFRLSFDFLLSNRHRFPVRPPNLAAQRPAKTFQVLAVVSLAAWACWVPTGQRLRGAQAPPHPNHPAADSALGGLSAAPSAVVDPAAQEQAQRAVQWGWNALVALDLSSARDHFESALELDASSPWPHLGLMTVYLALQDLELAQPHIQRAVDLASTQSLDHRQRLRLEIGTLQTSAALAWKEGSRSQHHELLELVEAAIGRYPADPALYVLRGRLSATPTDLGRHTDGGGIPWYRRALELEPDDAAAHHFLVYPLRAQGRWQAARGHAERFATLHDSPSANRFLVQLLLEQGEPLLALQHLLRAHDRHLGGAAHYKNALSRPGDGVPEPSGDNGRPGASWGEARQWAKDLRWLVAVEAALAMPQAEPHAIELMALDIDGRLAGLNCLPLLRFLQSQGRHRELLLQSRQCEAKDSFLAAVIGSAYRGQAQLALGRPMAAKQALISARAAHRCLLADLQAEADERPYALAAEVSVDLLQGKLELLVGDLEEGERRLIDLVQRLSQMQDPETWLRANQALQEIGTLADRAGRFQLSIATSRALGRIMPSGLGGPQQHLDATAQPSARPWRPLISSWVVWTDH